ncbi:MerR family transcriptional regulator [Exiguobacterium sp. s162]|uniref:MerR family transcriptional regulator n=1 Tax=Exiguobacterium sp. s162 TaxID=2751276 RepID=UPI001BE6F262
MGIDRTTYKSAQLCDELQIKPSTLRKWALLLQDAGHKFRHDTHGRRIYDDADLALMREFQKLKAMGGATVTSAAKDAVSTLNSRQSVRTATDIAGENLPAIPNEDLLLALQKLSQDNEELKRQNAEQLQLMNSMSERIARLEQYEENKELALQQSLAAIEENTRKKDVAEVAPTKRSWLDKLMGRNGAE